MSTDTRSFPFLEEELRRYEAAGVDTFYMRELVVRYGSRAATQIYVSDSSERACRYRWAVMRVFVDWQIVLVPPFSKTDVSRAWARLRHRSAGRGPHSPAGVRRAEASCQRQVKTSEGDDERR